eukprot:NODE_3597_length_755_cov_95.349858_g3016_i0.p1 GENE.NODE_3597_length_755_cov_95.349858_g3016_i0~~NODE_3597_length_755_cov_95.349858_g3016_i0.p1  ORF type:complete len:243 (+),score=61.31 NODE_3597_length_755_cov_95.349858_g3016_i0:29-730(+)
MGIMRSTFVGVREWIARHHNTTFDKAFATLASTLARGESYCQINIILNYAWYFERDKYQWHLQSVGGSDYHNGTYNKPQVRMATHARGLTPSRIQSYLRQGYCYACLAMGDCMRESAQHESKVKLHHAVLHSWDHSGMLWTERDMGSSGTPAHTQSEHYERVKQLSHRWPSNLATMMNRSEDYYADCSRPADYHNCSAQHAHIEVMYRRVQASKSKHEKEFMQTCLELLDSGQ